MATKSEMNLSKSLQPQFAVAVTAEGGGFEPPWRISEPSALAPRRDKPLCQPSRRAVASAVKEGEGFEPPRLESPPVFETGALPVQPTLRCSEPNKWTPEGIEPSFPGCRPGVFPLDDGPFDSLCSLRAGPSTQFARSGRTHTLMSREGIEPSASAFGEPRSDPIELPQPTSWSRQDSNLH